MAIKKQTIYLGQRYQDPDKISYALVHERGDGSNFIRIADASYRRLQGYLEGATAHKMPREVEVVNGIPKDKEIHKNYPSITSLFQSTLDRLLMDADIERFLK